MSPFSHPTTFSSSKEVSRKTPGIPEDDRLKTKTDKVQIGLFTAVIFMVVILFTVTVIMYVSRRHMRINTTEINENRMEMEEIVSVNERHRRYRARRRDQEDERNRELASLWEFYSVMLDSFFTAVVFLRDDEKVDYLQENGQKQPVNESKHKRSKKKLDVTQPFDIGCLSTTCGMANYSLVEYTDESSYDEQVTSGIAVAMDTPSTPKKSSHLVHPPRLSCFIQLYEEEWGNKVTNPALRNLAFKKNNAPEFLPLTSDLLNLCEYFVKEIKDLTPKVESDRVKENWRQLVTVTLTRLILFNKRRGKKEKVTDKITCGTLGVPNAKKE
ncbi:Hypothetical predicted protein, partial [Paramuricea clavata]